MSFLHRPDDYIGFTPRCPPTFYNKIVTHANQCLIKVARGPNLNYTWTSEQLSVGIIKSVGMHVTTTEHTEFR